MAYSERLTIVVAAGFRAAATAACEAAVPGFGNGFQVGLSATGAEPATHYWCGWQLTPEQRAAVEAGLAALVAGGRVTIHDGHAVTPRQVRTARGLQLAIPAGPVGPAA